MEQPEPSLVKLSELAAVGRTECASDPLSGLKKPATVPCMCRKIVGFPLDCAFAEIGVSEVDETMLRVGNSIMLRG